MANRKAWRFLLPVAGICAVFGSDPFSGVPAVIRLDHGGKQKCHFCKPVPDRNDVLEMVNYSIKFIQHIFKNLNDLKRLLMV